MNITVWTKKKKTDYVLLTIYLGKQLIFCSSDGRESAHIGGESNPLRVIRLFCYPKLMTNGLPIPFFQHIYSCKLVNVILPNKKHPPVNNLEGLVKIHVD